jgi:hypothetical protein
MRYLLFILTAGVFIACNSTDKNAASLGKEKNDSLVRKAMEDTTSYTTIEWLDSTRISLGKITEGQVIEVSWRFKNTGTQPLVIQNVTASCGCTIAEKPEQPVAPGGTDVIKAKFNSEGQHIGHVEKTVTVQANTKGGTAHYLSFNGEINK